jgi:hypothetical protein
VSQPADRAERTQPETKPKTGAVRQHFGKVRKAITLRAPRRLAIMRPPPITRHERPRLWIPPARTAWRHSATVVTTPAPAIIAPMTMRRPETGLCPEQEADLRAACNGSLTWAQYFRKWGPSL